MGEAKIKLKRQQGNDKTARNQESIRGKMLKSILVPLTLIFILVAVVSVLVAKNGVSEIRTAEITAESRQVANKVSEYFTKYISMTVQLAQNEELLQVIRETGPGEDITEHERFSSVLKTLTNTCNLEDQILGCWFVDMDPQRLVEDGNSGFISELGNWEVSSRPWYSQIIDADTTIVTEPYESVSMGVMVSSVITPIRDSSGNLIGVAALAISVDTIVNMMGNSHWILQDFSFFYHQKAGLCILQVRICFICLFLILSWRRMYLKSFAAE